ncbi:SpoIIE family protein phosphatase [Angustibacter sp. McL0619]|uniref:PP2C family protein-serine/threonine phosphatase n=1 Tax=Angustibacter sp. McL0619 TaxID=3415676 RepID=UPI003CEDB3E8
MQDLGGDGPTVQDAEGLSDDLPEAVRQALLTLRICLDSAPAMITVTWGSQHRLAYQNAESVRVLGRRVLGLPVVDAFSDMPADRWVRLDDVLASGRPIDVPRTRLDLLDAHGSQLVLRYVMAPLGEHPPYAGVVLTAVDASAEARAEQAADRGQLLAIVSEQMNAAADPDSALQALTDALVPAIADVAAVYVLSEAGMAASSGSTPSAITVSKPVLDLAGPTPPAQSRDEPSPWAAALAAGETVLIDVEGAADRAEVASGVTASWLAAAGGRNLVVVPLLVAGDMVGALVLLATGPRPRYERRDSAFFEDVAARAGAAVGHLRSYQQQRDIALQLQRALLPAILPRLPGLEVAGRYVAGSADVEVGGDWWDVHHLGAGRIGLGVGDVSGRGVPAAVLMGQARAGMHAAALADPSPVRVLTVLDEQVSDLVSPTRPDPEHRLPAKFATALYAVLEPAAQVLRVASAGHPPMLLREPGGRVLPVEPEPGAPLGLGVGGYTELLVPCPPGSVLVAFTDGLVESRTTDVETGIAAVAGVLSAIDDRAPVEEIADRLLLLADGTDDTALVVCRVLG